MQNNYIFILLFYTNKFQEHKVPNMLQSNINCRMRKNMKRSQENRYPVYVVNVKFRKFFYSQKHTRKIFVEMENF